MLVSSDAHLPFCGAAALGVFLLGVRRHGPGCVPRAGLRRASTVVYLTHMLFVALVTYGVCSGTTTAYLDNGVPPVCMFAVVLGCSLATACAVVPLSARHPALRRAFGI